jgi:hypothetical protein
MNLDELDPYQNPSRIAPGGENLLALDAEGNASVTRREPDERPNTWKDRKKIEATSFDAIREYSPRERSGIVDYQIMLTTPVSVSWRGTAWGEDREFLCHTHRVNDCPHTRLIKRYREAKTAVVATAQ